MDFAAPGSSDDLACPTYRARHSDRLRLDVVTSLRNVDEHAEDVKICNISTAGFMAECLRPVLIGSYVSVDLPGIGAVRAQVRWQVGGRMGGKFLDPVALEQCSWLADA